MLNAVARDVVEFTPIHAAAWILPVCTAYFLRFLARYILDYAVVVLDLFLPPSLLLSAAGRPWIRHDKSPFLW